MNDSPRGRSSRYERSSLIRELLTDVAGEAIEGPPAVLRAEFLDLGDGRTEMTFTQRGSLPADEYSRAMRGSLIFFDRLADHLAEELKARHDGD